MVRALHVVKTTEGAAWAAREARVLRELGIDVHVAVPVSWGEAMPFWDAAGVALHYVDCSLPLRQPATFRRRADSIRRLVDEVQPDIIHSHFVTNTIMLRLSLGRQHPVPRLFQVPGPLHLEQPLYRWLEIKTAGSRDKWIASSQYTECLYRENGVASDSVYLSYYGLDLPKAIQPSAGSLRTQLQLPADTKIVGNINYMYPPKRYLGHSIGLKGHEFIIEALARVLRQRTDVVGVFVGGQWGKGHDYEDSLRRLALQQCGKNLIFAGRVPQTQAASLWSEFTCAVHVPISENCGGVVEPLLHAVPTIASRVGGLPEVVVDGMTGYLVPARDPAALADVLMKVLDHPAEGRQRAVLGRDLILTMFDVNRTAREVADIYSHVIGTGTRPTRFDSGEFLVEHRESARY